MKTKSSPRKKGIQRLKYFKPLFPRSKTSRKTWRVKSYSVQVTKRLNIQTKIRTFKTSPNRRSKKTKQIVLRIGLFGVQECAVSYVYKIHAYKKQTKRQLFKQKLSTAIMTLGILGIAFFGLQLSGITKANPPAVEAQPILTKSAPASLPEPIFLGYSKPSGIKIPTIGVDASIETVGQLPDGSLETPDQFAGNVGWYKNSPTPGELGPTVMVGHVDNYKGPSVFWNLSKLMPGDIVKVQREDGVTVSYSVKSSQQFDKNNFPTELVYGNIDYAGLRLITCGGRLDPISGHYSANTVVFAEMIK